MTRNSAIIGKYLKKTSEKLKEDQPQRTAEATDWRRDFDMKSKKSNANGMMAYKNQLAMGAAAVIFGGLAWAAIGGGEPPAIPEPASRIFTFVVDNTDPLSPTQERLLDEKSKSLPRVLQPGDRVLVIEMTADSTDPIRYLFDGTFPAFSQGLDRAVIDKSEREAMDQKVLDGFMNDLDGSFEKAKSTDEKSNSPIFESMGAIGAYLRNQPGEPELNLFFASDFLQNAGGCSHYVKLETENCRALASLMDFTGVNVEAIYLSRPNQRSVQTQKHRALMKEVLEQAGEPSVVVREW